MKHLFWMLALLVCTINLGLSQETTVATNEEQICPVAQLEQNLKKLFSGRIDWLFYNNMSVIAKAKELELPVSQI